MKVIIVIMTAFLMQVSASTTAQVLTLKDDHISLKQVFTQIRKQTGYTVLCEAELINKAKPITVNLEKIPLPEALKKILAGQDLDYVIENKEITITKKEVPSFLERVVDAFTPPVDVRGVVLDEKGMALPGANIKVKGYKLYAVTDTEGKFYLPGVDDKAVLIVSFVGYKDVEVKAGASLNVVMELKSKDLEEVVVAYGRTTQQALTGSVTVVKGDDIRNLPNRSVDKSLQGLVPGLLVTSGTGQPGGGLSNFVLRGIATGPSDNNTLSGYSTLRNPLIVVDGIPVFQDAQIPGGGKSLFDVPDNNPMATLNPSDVESISVLKDAAAIALYGATASNGVILITTKKGKTGKPVVSIRSQADIASRIRNDIELLSMDEYMELLYETYRNSSPGITDEAILTDVKSKFPVRSDGSFYPSRDLTPLFYKNNASTFSNEFGISGGNGQSTYYLNLEWTKQDGVYRKTGFDRKSLRFNFENAIAAWFKLGMNTGLSYNQQDLANSETAQYGSIFYGPPLNPVYLENGEYNYMTPDRKANTLASLNMNVNSNTIYRGLSKLFAELSLFKGLKFTSSLGIDFLLTGKKYKEDPRIPDPDLGIGIGRIEQADIHNNNLINTNLLSYTREFGHHGLNILAGQEARINTRQDLKAVGTHLQFYTGDQIDQASTRTSQGNKIKTTGLSYFGQGNYDFRKKYFVSASIRSDGYSQFGGRQPFNTFWSLGAGWIISAEQFMQNAKPWLSYLKIRGSMGPAGNAAAINRNIKYQSMTAFNYLNSTTLGFLLVDTPPNTLIAPEKTFTEDAGLELGIFDNKIRITADYYQRKTTNAIYFISLPYASGFTGVQDNLGDIVNKGTELSLTADVIKSKSFSWNLNANWSSNRNTLVKANNRLPATVNGTRGLANEEGRNFNSFYMPVWAGVDPETGKGMWIDSLGKPNTDYRAAKSQWVGKPQPDGFGSLTNTLNYKGLSFSFQFYYQYGFKVYNIDPKLNNDGFAPFNNQQKSALNRWQKAGDIAANPKREMDNPVYDLTSTRNLFDGDYIRLQTVSLGYELPKKLIQPLHLSSLRVYAQGYNLALWSTKRPGTADISSVNVQGLLLFQYPQAQSYSFGINASF